MSLSAAAAAVSYANYTEPVYPITIAERFDEDVMKPLLSDETFNRKDRERLSQYNKHRLSGGIVNVTYKLSDECAPFGIGRLYPTDGIGIQSFRFDMRNPLTQKYNHDLDMENAHFCIAEKFCKVRCLRHEYITQYILNRDEWLSKVSSSRKKSKTEFLKILYGGNIKTYREDYEEIAGDVSNEGNQFLRNIQSEVEILMNVLWDENTHLHKLKCLKGKSNPKASLMSLLFQTEERRMLMFLKHVLKDRHNRDLVVLIHDGGHVSKLNNLETVFPEEILTDCSNIVSSKFGCRCIFTQKKIEHNWTPPVASLTEYDTRKIEFEKRNFLVGGKYVHIHQDNTIEFLKKCEMEILHANNWYYDTDLTTGKSVRKLFLKEWLADAERKCYDRIDFYPDVNQCPDGVFNLFKGFNAVKYEPETPLTNEEIEEFIKPIKTHLYYLSSGNEDYLLKSLAKIIKDPMNKSQVAILLRDFGDLLNEGGGTGKNLFLEWFGNEIIGEDYTYVVGDNREMYGNFNSQFEGKLFVIVEEASGRENHANHDILKAKITAKKQNVNKKSVAVYSVRDYTNWWFCSNNRNPIPMKNNRRFAVFDVNPAMRGNANYFNDLNDNLNNPIVKWAFYYYLKNICETYQSPIEFQNNIPKTSAYVEVRKLNAPLHLKWIVKKLETGQLRNDTVRNLYNDFKSWISTNRENGDSQLMSETAFGLLLNKSSSAGCLEDNENEFNGVDLGDKKKCHGVMVFTWNITSLIEGLKKYDLLNQSFIFTPVSDADTDCEM